MSKKKTIKQYKNEVYKLVNTEYDILGDYNGNKINIQMRHNNESCSNFEFPMSPNSFLRGQRCPKCSGRMKKTTEQFKKEVFKIEGEKYDVLGDYINNHTKILMRHNCEKCNNHEYDVTPKDFLFGYRCPKCFGTPLKTQEEFETEVYSLVQDKYTVLGKYKTNKTKILMKHNCKECDSFEFEMSPNSFLSKNQRCPKCGGTMLKTDEQFKSEVFNLVKVEYVVLEKYIGAHTKILFKHNSDKCNNHEFPMTPDSFLSGEQRCPKCGGTKKKTDKEFKQQIFSLVGDEYTVLEEYINDSTKIMFRHNNKGCGNYEYPVKPNSFLNGHRCPKCNESKGEQAIRHYCKDNNINFTPQYIYEDLLSDLGNPLKYDFAIFNDINKIDLKYLIEYDGEFHYKVIKYKNETIEWAEAKFAKQKYHDKLKNEYCIENNIELLRIPYWEFDNLERILTDYLIHGKEISELGIREYIDDIEINNIACNS